MHKPFLSVIIPAYKETKRLPLTLIDIDKHLKEQDFSYEIIVVDDGSPDDTAEVARRFVPLIKNLKVIANTYNQGKGGAVKDGMLIAKGDWRLFMDADNSTSIVEFNKMIPYTKKDYDVIIANRDMRGSRMVPPQSWFKKQLGNIGNIIIQILLVPGIWDTQCGFKCYSERAAVDIFSLAKIRRWGFDAETLALAKKLKYKIRQVPVFWVNDVRSHVKLSAYLQVFVETFKVRWWLLTGKYQIKKK